MQTDRLSQKKTMLDKYNQQFEAHQDDEIKPKKGLTTDLADCASKVIGEVAMKVCFALTLAFCIGC